MGEDRRSDRPQTPPQRSGCNLGDLNLPKRPDHHRTARSAVDRFADCPGLLIAPAVEMQDGHEPAFGRA